MRTFLALVACAVLALAQPASADDLWRPLRDLPGVAPDAVWLKGQLPIIAGTSRDWWTDQIDVTVLRFTNDSLSDWVTQVIAGPGPASWNSQLAIDGQGAPILLYSPSESDSLRLTRWGTNTWLFDTPLPEPPPHEELSPLSVQASADREVLLLESWQDDTLEILEHRSGDQWSRVSIPDGGLNYDPSLQIDRNGYPLVSYSGYAEGFLRLASWRAPAL